MMKCKEHGNGMEARYIYMYIQTSSVDAKKVMSGPTSGKTILGLYDTEIWQL